MKRYQDCNHIVRLYRRRHYISIPFYFIYHQYLTPFKVVDDSDGEIYNPKGKNLWKLLIGIAQHKMHWYYTSEEVFSRIKNRK
jgi:hypothetical protein